MTVAIGRLWRRLTGHGEGWPAGAYGAYGADRWREALPPPDYAGWQVAKGGAFSSSPLNAI